RRPEELRARAPALGQVHRKRRLAGAGRDGVQPDPGSRDAGRRLTGEGDNRDGSPQADQRARPDRLLRPTGHPAPTRGLALGERLGRPVRPGMWAPPRTDDLTTATTGPTTNLERPGSEARPPATPAHRGPIVTDPDGSAPPHRWIEVKPARDVGAARSSPKLREPARDRAHWECATNPKRGAV